MFMCVIYILDTLNTFKMQYFCKSVVGSSHKETMLPCQDSTLCEKFDKGCIMAVSDGHGSKTYVRSHIGSKLACSIAVRLTKQFVLDNYDILAQIDKRTYTPDNGGTADALFLDLFTRIHDCWYNAIKENVADSPFTNEERIKLGDSEIKEAFGCTLLVAVKTDKFTFAFHIGDGRIYTISYNNEWTQPVPWDSACEDNITTSLCESNPIDSFRYYVDSSANQPFIIFACSDGIEDCYGGSHDGNFHSDKLEVDYSEVLRAFLQDGESDFDIDCESFLKEQSRISSHDDMSIAFIIDDRFQLKQDWLKIVEYQRLKFEAAEEYRSYEIIETQLSERLKVIDSNIRKYQVELDKINKGLESKREEREKKIKLQSSDKACKDSAMTFNAKITQFQQDIKAYCDLYEVESTDVSKTGAPEVVNFKRKLIDYVSRAIKKALDLIRADIRTKQDNTIRLQSEIDRINAEIRSLLDKKAIQEKELSTEREKYNQLKEQKDSLLSKKEECYKSKITIEKDADNNIRLISDEIKKRIPQVEVKDCILSNEEVYSTLNISKRSLNENDEDVNIVVLSSNLIEITHSSSPSPRNISKDAFDRLLGRIKKIDPAIFSSDEKFINDCVAVLFYKKDGNCITKIIPLAQKEAREIWEASIHIAYENNNK